jgi:glycosyltransferase involved in cell wall biosynthesis
MEELRYSIVIPVYNEEECLPALFARLDETLPALDGDYEVIFVDDGSADKSAEMLKERAAKDSHSRIIQFEKNAGQSSAFDAGFKASRGDVVITMDADLQNDPADIPKLIEKLAECDAVSGWRVKRQDSLRKRVSTKIANWVRNKLSGEEVHDSASSLKAFKREALMKVKMFNGAHRFMPTLVKMEGYRVAEVPVSHHPRAAGTAKYGVWNRMFRAFYDLIGVRWMKSRRLTYKIKGGS